MAGQGVDLSVTLAICLENGRWLAVISSSALNLDTTRSQIATIVKVKIANFKCTGLMLRTLANPYIHLLP